MVLTMMVVQNIKKIIRMHRGLYRFIFITILLLSVVQYGFTQNAFKIKGRILNASSKKPVGYATLVLFKTADSSLVKSSLSDSVGNFQFEELALFSYYLKISHLLYADTTIKIDSINVINHIPLTIYLMPSGKQQLKEVTVTSSKPLIERKIDRLVFNVAGNVNIIGLNALDVLAQTPMIRVDNDESISIIGKGKVTIMINGRTLQMPAEALTAYLKAVPAERIERIEVITNPPAIYSAEGQGGIINIILKKNKKLGYSGTANLTLQKTTYEQGSLSMNMWYNKKNIRYYGSIFSALGAHGPTYLRYVFYPTQIRKSSTNQKEYSQGVIGTVGFDADISRGITLGASYNRMNVFPYQYTIIKTQFTNREAQKLDSASIQNNTNKAALSSQSANVHFVKRLDTANTQKRVVIDGDWSLNSSSIPNNIETDQYNSDNSLINSLQILSNSHLTTAIYSLNGIVYLPEKKHEWSFGSRIDFIRDNNNLFLQINDQGNAEENDYNEFIYHENTQALFVNFKTHLSKRWSFQSGLRGEFTQTKGVSHTLGNSINKDTYLKLFPTAYFLYRLNSKNTLSVNYGRRINRPGFSILNPYIRYLDQYTYSQGNPNLKPSISNNFELNETCGQNLNISLQYSFSNKGISFIPVPQNNSSAIIYQNTNDLSSRSFVFSGSYELNKIKWMESLNSFELNYNKIISTSKYTKPIMDGWSANFRSNNSFYFNKQRSLVGGLLFRYQFPGTESIYKYPGSYHFDLSGKYSLLNSKLQIGIHLSDAFKMITPIKYYVNDILYTVKANGDSRRLYLTVKYTFGNSNLKRGKNHFESPANGR